jgi:hypothetical protein
MRQYHQRWLNLVGRRPDMLDESDVTGDESLESSDPSDDTDLGDGLGDGFKHGGD